MKITQVLKSILFTIIAFHSISTSAQSTEYYSSVDDFIKKKKLEEFEFSLDTNSKNIRFYKNNNEFYVIELSNYLSISVPWFVAHKLLIYFRLFSMVCEPQTMESA